MEISYRLAAPMSTRSQLVATALTISSSVSRVTLKMSPCSVWARKKNMDLVLCVAEQTKIMPLSGSSRSFWVGAGRKEEKWISSKPLWQIFKLLCITHNTYILSCGQGKPQVPHNYAFVKTSSHEIRSLSCLQGLWQRRDMKTSSFQLNCYSLEDSCMKYGFNSETPPLMHNHQNTHPSAWDWAADIRLVPKVLVSDVIFWANEHTARTIRATWHCYTQGHRKESDKHQDILQSVFTLHPQAVCLNTSLIR